jgi:uncharacterized protein YutE (UPF0331/DUF86 family)
MRKSKPSHAFKRMLSKSFTATEAVVDVVATEVSYFNMDQKSENLLEMQDSGLISESEATEFKAIVVNEYINRIHSELPVKGGKDA